MEAGPGSSPESFHLGRGFFLKAEWHLWTGGGERGEQSGKASGSPGFGALGCDVGGPGDGQSREVQLQGALPRAHWLFTHP